jgi:phenylalanine-4-hydroxylase
MVTYREEEHETWRLIMARSEHFLAEMGHVIHPAYLDGWRELRLARDRIPTFDEVNASLARVGWGVAYVDGYIPTYEYVRLLAGGIFPLARVLRRREHIDYSPMPDMAHDLIGHLPMLFHDEHRRYLRMLAVAMVCAEANVLDHELFEANRAQAFLRHALAPAALVERAAARAERAAARLAEHPSELMRLGRLYLWSIEFGLMGTREDFKIFGSALMSATAECRSILGRPGAIHDFSLDATERDISFCDLQERYFVARDFARLREVLIEHEQRTSSWQEVGACWNGSSSPRSWTRGTTPRSTRPSTTAP